MTIILTLLYVLGFLLLCWVTYVAVMSFRAVRDQLHPVVKVLAYIVLAIGLVLDLILTYVIGTVMFLSLPKLKEFTFTARLKRHRVEGGWRSTVAIWICEKLLNPFVIGGHC